MILAVIRIDGRLWTDRLEVLIISNEAENKCPMHCVVMVQIYSVTYYDGQADNLTLQPFNFVTDSETYCWMLSGLNSCFSPPQTVPDLVSSENYFYLPTDDAESSDEDVAENALASPDRKRICSSRDNKKISVTCTPKPRSTPRPKHTVTTSASRSKTKNK